MNRLMRFFVFERLPTPLQKISKECAMLAQFIDSDLPETSEKTAGLRKLLEAKDCFVRAKVEELHG